MSIVVTHNSGFFSCCSVKLCDIIIYVNHHKELPLQVDSSRQFDNYKIQNGDITYEYFIHPDNNPNFTVDSPINYYHDYQFRDYSQLDYEALCPFVKKYFTPSHDVKNHIESIQQKYNMDYDNICVLFYRGNDKNTETKICGYDEYILFANKILEKNPSITFLIQSDETEFIELMHSTFPDNSFYLKDEVRHMNKCNNTVDNTMREDILEFSKKYLAITVIMSKCKYVVCGSGNCSIWIMFYRGNVNNVYQNLDNNWIIN